MNSRCVFRRTRFIVVLMAGALVTAVAFGQDMPGMPGMKMPSTPPSAQRSKNPVRKPQSHGMPGMRMSSGSPAPAKPIAPARKEPPQDMQSMPGMSMPSGSPAPAKPIAPAGKAQPQNLQSMPGMSMPPGSPSQAQPTVPVTKNALQDMQNMPGMTMPSNTPARTDQPSDMKAMPGMNTSSAADRGGMNGMGGQMMMGATGSYSMMRDASGTAWQPDSTRMEGMSGELAGWATMLHGYIAGIYDHQGGPRGGEKAFSESMLMGMAQNRVGSGTLTLHAMLSLDPLMGKSGYPLLLQTGETANGVTPLVDRQHPHDLFMELAGIYSVPLTDKASLFGYVGYPGEPALGPATFMHRFSGMDDPAAPISHHWLDSTHVTFGVVTGGFVYDDWKIEGSAFRGREPDQFRWNFDPFKLGSASVRLSWNPTPNWALQTSYGFLKSPEQLEPTVNQHRATASASYNLPFENSNWQTTLAWGRNNNVPGNALDAFLLESAISWYQHTIFARAENAAKDELFLPPSPQTGGIFRVSSLSLGYVYDIPVTDHLAMGLGAMGTLDVVPSAIGPAYGSSPGSYMLFTRLKLK